MSDAPPGEFKGSVHPTGHPLVARFTGTIPADSQVVVEFGLTTKYGRETSPVAAPEGGGAVSFLVGGMKAASTYHLRARVRTWDGKWWTSPEALFKTGPLPAIALPTLQASTTPGQTPTPGIELVNIIDPRGISVASDLGGNIIWYYDNTADASWLGYAFPIKPMMNGHFLAAITNLYSNGVPQSIPYNSVLREIDLEGTSVRELYLADLNTALKAMGSDVQALVYSHDVLPLPNGHTILIVQQQKTVQLTAPPGPGQFTILGDALVALDEKFKPYWTWSAFDWLDVNRHPMEFTAASGYDWTHCNGVQLAPDGNLVLSSRHQNWLMKLDYQGGAGSGAILWKLGYQGDFTLVGSATKPTDWFFAQHYPNLLAASGTKITSLSVFDNGNDRCYATPTGCPATGLSSPPPFSRGVIFQIDEAARTAQLAWQYPLNFYSYWGGNVMLFPDGHVEIAASEPVPIGTNPPSTDVPSQVVELANVGTSPTVVWKMTVVQGGTYRSYRIGSLYPGVTWGE
jgi:arylsulfate sulfotransferase